MNGLPIRRTSLLGKRRAVARTELIKGVRAVIDRVTIDAPKVPDDQLAKDVNRAFVLDPATNSYQIQIAAKDGSVTLTGQVDSFAERQLAELVASFDKPPGESHRRAARRA